MCSFGIVLIWTVFGFVFCEPPTLQVSKSLFETFQESNEGTTEIVQDASESFSEVYEEITYYTTLVEEFDTSGTSTTEFTRIEAIGCNNDLVENMLAKCDHVNNEEIAKAYQTEDENEKFKVACCALEEFEICSLRAYHDAKCTKYKEPLIDRLVHARHYLSAEVTCPEYRGFMFCEPPTSQVPKNLSDTFHEITEEITKIFDGDSTSTSDDVLEIETGTYDFLETMLTEKFDNSHAPTTEFTGIDANTCNKSMLKNMVEKCDNAVDNLVVEAEQIEDEHEKNEVLCCALQDFEKCSLQAYDDASCTEGKHTLRENLKAARLFLSVVANITCTEFRGIDANGCNRGLLKDMIIKCDNVLYKRINFEVKQIEGDSRKMEAVCCALDDFEKCRWRSYDDANCAKDKVNIRDIFQTPRRFYSVVGNMTCADFPSQCLFFTSEVSSYPILYSHGFTHALVSLVNLLP